VLSLGKFDNDTITEDFDITIKMRKIGKSPVFAEKAIAWTLVPETWCDWTRQRVRWTRGQAETIWKHRNIFKKQQFDFKFVVAFYDMFFMDVVLFFIKIIGATFFFFLFRVDFLYILLFTLILYFGIELFSILTAIILSHRKSELRYLYLFPIMVLIYRPYYAVVRFKAYLDLFLRKKSFW
jgi:biofilm PGA synthesis N-glycosyltransferase PgaC